MKHDSLYLGVRLSRRGMLSKTHCENNKKEQWRTPPPKKNQKKNKNANKQKQIKHNQNKQTTTLGSGEFRGGAPSARPL